MNLQEFLSKMTKEILRLCGPNLYTTILESIPTGFGKPQDYRLIVILTQSFTKVVTINFSEHWETKGFIQLYMYGGDLYIDIQLDSLDEESLTSVVLKIKDSMSETYGKLLEKFCEDSKRLETLAVFMGTLNRVED